MSSISSVTTQSATSSATAATQPKKFEPKDAEVALFKTEVDKLWYETFKGAEWYEMPFRFLSYVWNRSEAVEKDTFSATIADFNDKLTNLVNATALTTLTDAEATKLGAPSVQFANESQQKNSLDRKNAADKAEKEFYEVFKKRCTELEIASNSKEYETCMTAVKTKITKASQESISPEVHVSKEIIAVKMESLKVSFEDRLYGDAVKTVLPTKMDDLTIDSFKKAVADVKRTFPSKGAESVETSIRQALVEKFKSGALEGKAKKYKETKDNEFVKTFKEDLLKAHKAEAERLDKEVKELRGPNNHDGIISKAEEATKAAQDEFNAAEKAFKEAYVEIYKKHKGDLTVASIKEGEVEKLVKMPGLDASLKDVSAKFNAANEKKVAADKEVAKLQKTLKEDAVFAGPQVDALDAKIAELEGPAGNNGTVDAAYKKLAPAQTKLTDAEKVYSVAHAAVQGQDPVAALYGENNATLESAKANFFAAKAELEAAQKTEADLQAELNQLKGEVAVLKGKDRAEIISGKLVKEQEAQKDASVIKEARDQADKLGKFFEELSKPVTGTEEDKKVRFDALKTIIGA